MTADSYKPLMHLQTCSRRIRNTVFFFFFFFFFFYFNTKYSCIFSDDSPTTNLKCFGVSSVAVVNNAVKFNGNILRLFSTAVWAVSNETVASSICEDWRFKSCVSHHCI